MIKVGILGLARREGMFAEVGLRSWQEAGGAAVEQALLEAGEGVYVIHRPLVVRSVRAELERIQRDWCDAPSADARCDLILTVGGTGFAPADVMPEASMAVIERPAPGVAELLRRDGLAQADLHYVLSRAVAGIRKRTVIINLPGPGDGPVDLDAVSAAMRTLLPFLPAMVRAAQRP